MSFLVRDLKRNLIKFQKKFDLLKYNVDFRIKRGQIYDIQHDLNNLINNK